MGWKRLHVPGLPSVLSPQSSRQHSKGRLAAATCCRSANQTQKGVVVCPGQMVKSSLGKLHLSVGDNEDSGTQAWIQNCMWRRAPIGPVGRSEEPCEVGSGALGGLPSRASPSPLQPSQIPSSHRRGGLLPLLCRAMPGGGHLSDILSPALLPARFPRSPDINTWNSYKNWITGIIVSHTRRTILLHDLQIIE